MDPYISLIDFANEQCDNETYNALCCYIINLELSLNNKSKYHEYKSYIIYIVNAILDNYEFIKCEELNRITEELYTNKDLQFFNKYVENIVIQGNYYTPLYNNRNKDGFFKGEYTRLFLHYKFNNLYHELNTIKNNLIQIKINIIHSPKLNKTIINKQIFNSNFLNIIIPGIFFVLNLLKNK